ncbi:MAG: iron-sulfur cluster assembly scaffold protein [Bacillota bacterium]
MIEEWMLDSYTNMEYSQNVIDHFINPRNVGKLKDANAYAKVGDPKCGDYIELYLKVDFGVIEDIKYLVYGCAGAISTTSALTEVVKGKSLNAALEVTDDEVIEYLGGIPERKRHCSLLGVKALHSAIMEYRDSMAKTL